MKLAVFLKSIFFYTITLIISLVFTPVALLLTFLPARIRYDNPIYFWLTKIWCNLIVWSTGIRFSVKGKENLPRYPNQPAIIVINHTSALDIPVVESLLSGYPHVWFSRHEYGYIPLFGSLVKRMHILVNRNNTQQSFAALKKGINRVKEASRHLVIFPEGTRHNDGEIHEFHGGFALMAQQLGRPVIPIVIQGLDRAYPKNRLLIDSYNCHVKISIGVPLHCQSSMSRDDFVEMVRTWFKHECNLLKP